MTTEQPEQAPPQPSGAALARREELQLELWAEERRINLAAKRADMEALDAAGDGPMTPRQNMAVARIMSENPGALPASFRGGARFGAEMTEPQRARAAAAMFLAAELGRSLGMSFSQSLLHVQVVEGNPQLKPASARGLLLAAGCFIEDETIWNRHGIPVAHVISFARPEWKAPQRVEFRIEQAVQAGLCEVQRDEVGEVVRILARSDQGKPLPWELYTADMLRHRCTSRVVNMYGQDMTAGLDVGQDTPDQPHVRDMTLPPPRLEPQPAAASPEYDYVADIELIDRETGSRDWAPHAGAKVRRRTKVQLAADRLAKWAEQNPDAASLLLGGVMHPGDAHVPAADVEDAEIVPEPVATEPHSGPLPTGAGKGFPGAAPDDPNLDDAAREIQASHAADHETELREAWEAVYDLTGASPEDTPGIRMMVYSWFRTQLPDTGLTGPDDLTVTHVRSYLRAMEGDDSE